MSDALPAATLSYIWIQKHFCFSSEVKYGTQMKSVWDHVSIRLGKNVFTCWCTSLPLPLLGHIWDVMLVWMKRNINRTVSVLQYCVLL